LNCLRGIENKPNPTAISSPNPNLNPNLILGFNPSLSAINTVSIDLVGHLEGAIDVGTLKTGKVRFLSDLSSKEYYRSISQVIKAKIKIKIR
jgi:hypothetical protein